MEDIILSEDTDPKNKLETYFDSPERSSNEEVLKEIQEFRNNPLIDQLLEGFPDITVIINHNRQLVAFNSKALTAFNAKSYFDLIGKRLGEALNCIHAFDHQGGCGTSQFCQQCGAAKAIKISKDLEVEAFQECMITVESGGKNASLDFFVRAQPIKMNGKTYTMFAVRDIANDKRREALERVFFHDVLNTANALDGLSQILSDTDSENEKKEISNSIKFATQQLISEIIAQRDLRYAEDGQLIVDLKKLACNTIPDALLDLYKNHELSKNKSIQITKLPEDLYFISDFILLIRCLSNLLKNALEATEENGIVKIFVDTSHEFVSFNIQSEKIISHNVQLQLFQRSFSTKQTTGRGLGLYSVKLIVEQYLKGKATYVSNNIDNTIFTIALPKNTK